MRLNLRFIIAIIVAAVSLFGYFFNTSKNEVTGETQHVNMSADQEIALGLQAAPEMAAQYGGESSDTRATTAVQQVGQKIIASTKAGRHPINSSFTCWLTTRQSMLSRCPAGKYLSRRAC